MKSHDSLADGVMKLWDRFHEIKGRFVTEAVKIVEIFLRFLKIYNIFQRFLRISQDFDGFHRHLDLF